MAKDYTDKILNDIEKDALTTFVDNPTMVEAVRKVLLAGIYFNGTLRKGEPADPTINFALGFVSNGDGKRSNEEIGADIRAAWEGIRLLEVALSNIAKYKKEAIKTTTTKNPAR